MLALIQEREPLKLEDLPLQVQVWILAVGGFSAFALVVWLLLRAFRSRDVARSGRPVPWGRYIAATLVGGVIVMLVPAALRIVWNAMGWIDESMPTVGRAAWYQPLADQFAFRGRERPLEYTERVLPAYAASCALMAVLLPVLSALGRMRWRRIWALARLSFKEAVRRRVLWGFSALLLFFLFASWFLPYKPEDQVRNYVKAVYWAMTPLLLVTAAVLASFSIPGDVRNQTIHTIVTKPVERFEIIIGRFLGFTMLMTLVLVAMCVLSLIYVTRGIEQEAAEESLKAREPIYGDLQVINPKDVGYEWGYRRYITGAARDEEAIWTFRRLQSQMANQDTVRCEFTFDVFRTTKGEENKGIYAGFTFKTWRWQPARLDEYRREYEAALKNVDPELKARAEREHWSEQKIYAMKLAGLAEKYGFFLSPSNEVVDFHTLFVEVPGTLFKTQGEWQQIKGPKPPPFQVVVQCESATQYLGMAKHDLYLLAGQRQGGADLVGFGVNFLKGAAGLWLRICLVIGVAVTCSTYLSGVISFLTTMFLYGLGLSLDFIQLVAAGKTVGGGPVVNALRLGRGINAVTPLDQSPGIIFAEQSDKVVQWILDRIMNMIPDVDRFDLTNYVAEGFNVGGTHLLMTAIMLAGYLLPWLLLAYYLMKSREVASTT
jgi:ABC-type transport system involved in multi-copper enzyme maturation permease subunit